MLTNLLNIKTVSSMTELAFKTLRDLTSRTKIL